MKGAHAATKAAKLLELISTGLLFNGTGISMLESMHRDYITNKFSPWKLVFASDMSPAGSFRMATVSGLSEFFDTPREDEADDSKPKSRMFPSASTVSRERQAFCVSKTWYKNGQKKLRCAIGFWELRVVRLG